MRNRFLSLLAVYALAVPLSAQAQAIDQGNRTDKIIFTYTGEILPGQEQAFRQTAEKIVTAWISGGRGPSTSRPGTWINSLSC